MRSFASSAVKSSGDSRLLLTRGVPPLAMASVFGACAILRGRLLLHLRCPVETAKHHGGGSDCNSSLRHVDQKLEVRCSVLGTGQCLPTTCGVIVLSPVSSECVCVP